MKTKLLLLFLMLSFLPINAQVPTNGLLFYYPFNGNTNDVSGNNINANAKNLTLTSDRFGKPNSAYLFNGTNSSMDAYLANYPQTTNSRTITGWFKAQEPVAIPSEYYFTIASYGAVADSFKMNLYKKGYFDVYFEKQLFASQENYFNNQWTFFAMVYDDNTKTTSLYINNVLADKGTVTSFTKGFSSICSIGKNNGTNYFEGALDDLGLWNRALTPNELTDLYNETTEYTLIPDPNFEKKLIELGMDSGAIDGKVLSANIVNVTELQVRSSSISDLTGIENFKKLKTLNCNDNNISNLDVSKNVDLTWLECRNNKLSSLDVSKNTHLSIFSCGQNNLTELNVFKNPELTYLYCENNNLTSLNLWANPVLEDLYFAGNKISKIDVTENPLLLSLAFENNTISSLDISKNLKLIALHAANNKIITLNLSAHTALKEIDLSNNNLTYVNLKNGKNTILVKQFLNFSGNPKLTCIQVDNENYANTNWSDKKDITASYNTYCDASYTLIPDIYFEQRLINLGIDAGNADGKIMTVNIKNLTSLNVSQANISDLTGIQDFTSLTSLYCSQNNLKALNVSKNTSLTTLVCNNNQITALDVSNNIALTELTCYANKLTSLDVKANTALTKLDSGSNQYTSLDVSKNTALTFLGCNTSLLTTIDVSKNTALTLLDCRENKITNLDVSKIATLTELYCQSNQLKDLDLSKNKSLEFLNGSKNQLSTLDFSIHTNLVGLYANGNQLTSLNLKNGNNTKIQYLNLTNNPNLSCIQVDDNVYFDGKWAAKKDSTATFNINCSLDYAPIPDASFEQKLIDLGIDTDGLNGKITITDASKINSLDLSNSNIKDLTGIESFTSLTYLDCSNNQLSNLNVSQNVLLETLNASSNQIKTLDLSANSTLTIIYVASNPLQYINLQNGNNKNMIIQTVTGKKTANTLATSFLGLTNLACVKVDDAVYSNANWSKIKESSTIYSSTCSLGIEESVFDKVVVYPNPTKGEVNIDNVTLEKASVYNLLGQLVKTFELNSADSNHTINLNGLPQGVYYIYLINQDAASAKKVIIE